MAKWSYSQLALYKKCPLLFFWLRVEKRPHSKDDRASYIGWLLGAVIERFYVEHWYREPAVLEARMRAALPALGAEITTREGIVWQQPGEESHWQTRAAEAIPAIISTIRRERLLGPLVGHEYDIYVTIANDQIFGRIDLLIYDGERLILLDEKGGGTVGKWIDADQLRLYALGVLSDPRFRRLPTHVGFWWTRHDKIVWRPVSRKSLLKFVVGIEQTLANIKAKVFEPKPSSYCRLCPYWQSCAVGKARVMTGKDRGLPIETNAGRLAL